MLRGTKKLFMKRGRCNSDNVLWDNIIWSQRKRIETMLRHPTCCSVVDSSCFIVMKNLTLDK